MNNKNKPDDSIQNSFFWAGSPIFHENFPNLHYVTPIGTFFLKLAS